MRFLSGLLAAAFLAPALCAQTPPPSALKSHEVNPDGSVTLRLSKPEAKAVSVSSDMTLKPLPMQRGEDGVWTVTTPALPPEIYSYTFVADGVAQLDPLNREVVPNLLNLSSFVEVPGTSAQPWDLTPVAHGEVSHHMLTTHAAVHLPADQEPYVVYTPPGYDARRKGGYPVLYLLHGFSDSEVGWTDVGRAHLILDSLIAANKIVPMVVVMPLGYGDYNFVTAGPGSWKDPATVNAMVARYDQMLTTEVIPAVEREYNVAKDRNHRAIAGLSMGGLESLSVGLHHPELFAYVGGFSSAVQNNGFDQRFASVDPAKANLKLLWVACGKDDQLITPNRDFTAWAKSKGLPITPIETEGKHTWLVWRDNLIHFTPLLFR